MIDFTNINFVKSIKYLKDAPNKRLKEILIVGRSNVGKSSLINALSGRKKMAFTSSKPGHTKLLNYFEIDETFYLVDAPGYGYAKGGVDLYSLFNEIMDNYLKDNANLKAALLLIDSRRCFTENDDMIFEYFKGKNIPCLIVMTKSDKLNQAEKARSVKYLKEREIEDYSFVSNTNQKQVDELKKRIELLIKY